MGSQGIAEGDVHALVAVGAAVVGGAFVGAEGLRAHQPRTGSADAATVRVALAGPAELGGIAIGVPVRVVVDAVDAIPPVPNQPAGTASPPAAVESNNTQSST